MWYYKDEVFTEEMIGDHIGFVYMITELETGIKYIGKKLFYSIKKLKPLKGQKRRRTLKVQTDWMDYFGSSEEVKFLVEKNGRESFKREILYLCTSKGEMGYIEAKEQFDRNVLLRDDYYNGIISCRINKKHVLPLKNKFTLDQK